MDPDARRLLLVVIAIVLVAPMVMMLFAWPMVGMADGGHMWDTGGGGWVALASLALIMLVLVGALGLLFRWIAPRSATEDDPALEALRVAYARGELTDEEFEHRRDRLE